jgi:hypothetical protein
MKAWAYVLAILLTCPLGAGEATARIDVLQIFRTPKSRPNLAAVTLTVVNTSAGPLYYTGYHENGVVVSTEFWIDGDWGVPTVLYGGNPQTFELPAGGRTITRTIEIRFPEYEGAGKPPVSGPTRVRFRADLYTARPASRTVHAYSRVLEPDEIWHDDRATEARSGGLLLSAATGVSAADQTPVLPQPRKRLGPQPSREITKSDGQSVVGGVQTIEKQFLNTFQSYVATSYNALTARLPDEPSLRARYEVRMRLNTGTNEPAGINIVGALSERRRLLLLEAISQTCKAVICPAELRKKYGEVLEFSFDLVASYHSGKP